MLLASVASVHHPSTHSESLFAKIVARGFACNGPDSYLRDPWNILDFGIVCVSLAMLLGIPQVALPRVVAVSPTTPRLRSVALAARRVQRLLGGMLDF